jgi:hypothetical protein
VSLVTQLQTLATRIATEINDLERNRGRYKYGEWMPTGNNAAVPIATGLPAPSVTGTSTARNVANTRFFTALRRHGQVSAATAPSLAEYRQGAATFWRGNVANAGGFFLIIRFGVSDAAAVSGARMFVGLDSLAASAATNVNPTTLFDLVGIAQIDGSTNLQIICNDNAGAASAVDLGVNFPANTLSTDAYRLELDAAPNGSAITYSVLRENTGATASGTLSTNIPTATTFMGIKAWRSNNATALAVGIDLMNAWIRTKY